MFKRAHGLLLAVLLITLCGPAALLPQLSAHSPVWSGKSPTAPHAPTLPDVLRLSPVAFGTIKVKDVATAAAKFKTRASAAQGDYGTGVANAANDWEQASAAAEDNYKTSVTQAAADGRYGRGVRGSAERYRKNATTLGPQRYGTGIANAQDTYAQSMAPVLQTIAGLTLPPRGVKGTNGERSNIVATALRRMKVGK